MGVLNPNSTDYVHPDEPNLLNLHKAMEYDFEGKPHVRVTLGSDTITINGNVNLIDNVRVNNSTTNPVPVFLTNVPTTSTVYQGTSPWVVTGTVAVNNFPTSIIATNFTNTVYQGTSPWITNTTVTNWPALQLVNGTVYAVQSGTWSVGVNSLPAITGTVAVSNFPTTSTVYQGTNPWTITGSVNAAINGEVSLAGSNPDAFGRGRVSEPFTLGDYKHLYAIDPNFLDSTANGGSVTFVPDQASCLLATANNSAGYAIHQTKFYHHYQPGKSQLIYGSFCFRAPHRNVTKRTGYFDASDGIYFEQVGSDTADGSTVSTSTQTLNWVLRTFVGGSPNESDYSTTVNGQAFTYKRRVPQSEWNVDKCDGTGPSGFKLDITKTQLCWIDFQWLGVGRVRCGFAHAGKLITAHEYYHDNVLSTVYMSNPNLPVRCEIRNTGVTSGGLMDQICSTVMSEGGYVESGIDWSVYATPRTTPSAGQTRFPLLAIRLKNSFKGYSNRMSVRPGSLGLYAETNSIVYEVVKFPSATSLSTTDPGGLVWTSADTDSGVEYCVNATSFISANGDRFASGYVPSGSSQNSLSPVATGSLTSAKKNIISQNIDSTDSEVYCVLVSTVNAGNNVTANVAATIQWREIY